MKSKKAQIWGMDLMAALALFLVGVVIMFTYSLNQPDEAREELEFLFYDGEIVADSLLSSGYPSNWDKGNVMSIGVVDNNKINQTKLEELYNIIYVDGNYSYTRSLFSTEYDYYFFLGENITIDSSSIDGIGKPGVSRNNVDAENLIKITRFVTYSNKTMPLYLYIWEE